MVVWDISTLYGNGPRKFLKPAESCANGNKEEVFLGEDKEWLIIYCKSMLKKKNFDFFVFGHRHLPIDFRLTPLPGWQ